MIRIMLVDDHALFRQGLMSVLDDMPDIRVVEQASSYAQAIELLHKTEINVVVADLSMPGRDGIDLIAHIKISCPRVAVLVLSMHEDSEYATRALRSGALGYLTKATDGEELALAIRRVASGRTYLCPAVNANLYARIARDDAQQQPHETLSRREFRIFELLVQCHKVTAIARQMSLSTKTVSTHKINVLRKMGMTHQGELVKYAIEHKLLGH